MTYIVASFYHFAHFPDCEIFQPKLKQFMVDHDVKGTILVAPEGLNGTISGLRENIDAVLGFIRSDDRFKNLEHKESEAPAHVFEKVKVKRKKELISLGEYANPLEKVGTYIDPKDWNDFIKREDVILLDTRNHYETHVGTFQGAIDPKIRVFKKFPEFVRAHQENWKGKKIGMFCTGGIRCEKTTAWMKEQGIEDVYHLKGGILKYIEEVPPAESLWEGECYVFDERTAVDQDLSPSDDTANCPNCGHPLTTKDRCQPEHVPGVKCRFCATHKRTGKETSACMLS